MADQTQTINNLDVEKLKTIVATVKLRRQGVFLQ